MGGIRPVTYCVQSLSYIFCTKSESYFQTDAHHEDMYGMCSLNILCIYVRVFICVYICACVYVCACAYIFA